MKKHLTGFLMAILLFGGLYSAFAATNTFPTTLNTWADDEVIESEWANALEEFIGASGSAVVSSHDYMIKNTNPNSVNFSGKISIGTAIVATSTDSKTINASSSIRGVSLNISATTSLSTATITSFAFTNASGSNATITTATISKITTPLLSCFGSTSAIGTSATGTLFCNGSMGDGGGGATASSTFEYVFNAGGATLPNSNFPALMKNTGTHWVDTTLDFDQTTQEDAYYEFTTPNNIGTVASSNLITSWRTTDASSSQTVIFQWGFRCVGDNQQWDATTSPSMIIASTSDTFLATSSVHIAIMNNTPTSSVFSANKSCQVKLSRDVANDTIGRDVKFIRAILQLLW